MSNRGKNQHIPLSTQGVLFDALSDGSLDLRGSFREALSRSLRNSKLSRWQVCAEISRLSGREISKGILDKMTSKDHAYAIRAEDLPALIAVLGSVEFVRPLFEAVGVEILSFSQTRRYRLARLLQRRAEVEKEIEELSRDENA
jgi:hypothetical protein